jgi:hypothetical protein
LDRRTEGREVEDSSSIFESLSRILHQDYVRGICSDAPRHRSGYRKRASRGLRRATLALEGAVKEQARTAGDIDRAAIAPLALLSQDQLIAVQKSAANQLRDVECPRSAGDIEYRARRHQYGRRAIGQIDGAARINDAGARRNKPGGGGNRLRQGVEHQRPRDIKHTLRADIERTQR